jgi:hypothetical protein
MSRAGLIAACMAIVSALPALSQQSKSEPYRIVAVRAFLYLNQKDSLSANIIDEPEESDRFQNVFTGPHWLGSPSEQVLITVEIGGRRGAYGSDRTIHLTVKTPDGKVLLERSPRIGLLGDSGKWFETFVVYGIGCDAFRIRAEIIGQNEPSVVERRIPFFCGE